MRYKVMVEWVVCAEVEVEASSIDEAIDEVNFNDSLIPAEGSYVDGSLVINYEMTYQNNRRCLS